MKRTRILSALLALAMILSLPINTFGADFKTVSPYTGLTYTHQSKMIGKEIHNGIDISSHNTITSWKEIKNSTEFVIIRIGYRGYGSSGSINADKNFATNIKNAKANGLKVGVYFYSQAITTQEAVDEANYVLKTLNGTSLDLPVFFDYEFADVSTGRLDSAWRNKTLNKRKMTDNALAFLDHISKNGYRAMIYANKSFLSDNVDNRTITEKGYGIWVAHYTKKTDYTGEYVAWQYSDKGKNSGLASDNIDSNFWYGDFGQSVLPIKKFTADDLPRFSYTGSTIKPIPTIIANGVKLVAGADFSVKYENNINVGIATATIKGINDYKDYQDKVLTFEIAPKKVTGLTATDHSTNTITIKWDKHPDCDEYRVYVYRSAGWVLHGKTTDTNYIITGLASASNYAIRMTAMKKISGKEYVSGYCTSISEPTTPAKVDEITSSATDTSIKLKWKAQAGATTYQIQQYNSTKKAYSTIATVEGGKNNSYTVSDLKPNTKYQYRIRATKLSKAGTTENGAYSSAYTTYTSPAKPTLKAITTPSSKRIKASWSTVTGVTGYQVQWSTYSDFSANYKSVNVAGATKSTATIVTFRSKCRYYVRVRAYKTIDGKNIYSKWSNSKYITVK